MTQTEVEQLAAKRCRPCEGEISKYTFSEAQEQSERLSGWELSGDGQRIRKNWQVRDFSAAIDFFREIAVLAESEGHHPDLHLENYRSVRIELSTHAIGGLSENDFILAAKIDQLPVARK